MSFFPAFIITFIACWIGVPILMGVLRWTGVYITVQEQESKVFILFGKVLGVIDTPGLHFPFLQFGPRTLTLPLFGSIRSVSHTLDQQYLRSQPVNSEEGTPMGVGVWYEMKVGDPVEFLFRNTDPRGSLQANVANAAVRCLSNMPLETLLEDRHKMSRVVRAEVSPKSEGWGYKLGSVYIRKVHFRDGQMIEQIMQKVVNRLRQVTSAIRQMGQNQVNLIASAAEKEAASEFARAAAMRPYLVGMAIQEISADKEILEAMFEILETKNMLAGDVALTLIPPGPNQELLSQLLASNPEGPQPTGESSSAHDAPTPSLELPTHPPDLPPGYGQQG
jgi:regulator of protease activity HflC (stomatin/prohibitin superfamily)